MKRLPKKVLRRLQVWLELADAIPLGAPDDHVVVNFDHLSITAGHFRDLKRTVDGTPAQEDGRHV